MARSRGVTQGGQLLLAGVALVGTTTLTPAALPAYVEEALDRAKAAARDIPLQAEALARLAWPPGGPADPQIAAAARDELVHFGQLGLPALRSAIQRVDPLYQADVTAALIEARYQQPAGKPPDYLPGLEEAIWFGTSEAQRVAATEIARFKFPPALLSTIDAAYEHPEIARSAIRALGRMGDARARFFLTEVLTRGADHCRKPAAQALAALGDTALDALRDASRSEVPGVRQAAMQALLPRTGTDDLVLLHEYATRHPDEEPRLAHAVRERAAALEAPQEEKATSGEPNNP